MGALIQPDRSRVLLRGFAMAASIGLSIYGAANLTHGLAVPVTAQVAQERLDRQFEARLEEQAQAPHSRATATTVSGPARAPVGREPTASAAPKAGPMLFRLGVARLGISEVVRSGEATHERLAGGPVMIKRGDAASPVTVLSAHRDTHFLFIRDLQQDDVVTLQSDAGRIDRYRVIGFETVRWDRFSYPLDPARPLLALATCYPFGGIEYGGPWRRVAWAERIG